MLKNTVIITLLLQKPSSSVSPAQSRTTVLRRFTPDDRCCPSHRGRQNDTPCVSAPLPNRSARAPAACYVPLYISKQTHIYAQAQSDPPAHLLVSPCNNVLCVTASRSPCNADRGTPLLTLQPSSAFGLIGPVATARHGRSVNGSLLWRVLLIGVIQTKETLHKNSYALPPLPPCTSTWLRTDSVIQRPSTRIYTP